MSTAARTVPTREQILVLLRRHGHLSAPRLADQLGITSVGVRRHLALLKRDGVVPEAGPGPRTCARGVSTSVYFRDPDDNLVEFTVYEQRT